MMSLCSQYIRGNFPFKMVLYDKNKYKKRLNLAAVRLLIAQF